MSESLPRSATSSAGRLALWCTVGILGLVANLCQAQDDNGDALPARSIEWRLTIPAVEDVDASRAIEIVRQPIPPSLQLNSYPFEIERRLQAVSGKVVPLVDATFRYKFEASDERAWAELLADREADDIARMCAAVFLYGNSIAAEEFLDSTFENSDLETRLNSTIALTKIYQAKKAPELVKELSFRLKEIFVNDEWKAFADLRLDTNSRGHHFLIQIASILSAKDEASLLPVLELIGEREPSARKLTRAYICQCKSDQACELMVRMIKSGKYDSAKIATALARNNYGQAVPAIADLLSSGLANAKTNPSEDAPDVQQSRVLSALLVLKSGAAIPKVQEFIAANKFPEITPQAKRLVVHLGDPDPVAVLLRELDAADETSRTASIIQELHSYEDARCVSHYLTLAKTSVNFWTRLSAILALEKIPGDQSLFALAELSDEKHPDDLVTLEPQKDRDNGFFQSILIRKTRVALENRTRQSFGNNAGKWSSWIENNPSGK